MIIDEIAGGAHSDRANGSNLEGTRCYTAVYVRKFDAVSRKRYLLRMELTDLIYIH